MTLSRSCPAHRCGVAIASAMFMCRIHWRMVPSGLRAAVYQCYEDWRNGFIGAEELRARQQPAIDVVNRRLSRG